MIFKIKNVILFIGFAIAFSSCVRKLEIKTDPNAEINANNLTELSANDDFDWETSLTVTSSIQTLDNSGAAIPHIKVSLYTDYELFDGKKIISGFTDENGLFELDYRIATATDSLVVTTDYIGFIDEVKVPIIDGQLNYIFGGIPTNRNEAGAASSYKRTLDYNAIDLKFLGSWNGDGVPSYLESQSDIITSDFLDEINAILPSKKSAPDNHPEYFADNYEQSFNLIETADIWITFVSEGSRDRNTLAYYTFDKNNPPQGEDDIEECTVIFPNASFDRSGGGLYAGDKVHIGQFPAGTSIGWLLITKAYDDKHDEIKKGKAYLFSHKDLNELSDSPYQQHIVMLKDLSQDRFIISFEEEERPKKDEDFNDNMFYATVSPISAVEDGLFPTFGIAVIDNDADDDGVDDNFDDYPEDANLAFNSYYPSEGNSATLAFEDLWPSKGDYDFNDLIIDYNYNTITNADNEVVKLLGEFVVRAIGAGFHNGFGFELENVLSDQVSAVTGTVLEENYIVVRANGTEAGQSNATIIVFDDAWNHGYGNTDPSKDFAAPTETIQVEIQFTTPIPLDQFGLAPFNPFIIVNQERGREIHMANYAPTNLADLTYFGQYNDDSNTGTGKYYKTVDNLPWVINIPTLFDYPIEKSSVDQPHLKFIPWVESGGSLFNDWYLDKTDYRNPIYIY